MGENISTFFKNVLMFFPIVYMFFLRLLIFLNAENQMRKSEISSDNQRIG